MWIDLRKLMSNDVEVGRRSCEDDAGFQASDGPHIYVLEIGIAGELGEVHGERNPDVWPAPAESRGHDADESSGSSIEGEALAHDAWIGVETLAPRLVGHHKDGGSTRLGVLGGGQAAEKGIGAHEGEQICGGVPGAELLSAFAGVVKDCSAAEAAEPAGHVGEDVVASAKFQELRH